ncbi:MAG: hypothetical protein BRD50_03705 [Bacteroidetes bacterium SW_11_45_7]|jgi:hypothetical protein|nr:MAG: hypothetical protein BRD50_03705 [Bacteroidetes bacterium SW_11_45_7]
MEAQQTINFKADHLTFQDQVKETEGEHFSRQSAIFFERAINECNKGLNHSSIETARFALQLANVAGDYLAVYVNGFLAHRLLANHQYRAAYQHVKAALDGLDKRNRHFQEDLSYYLTLQSQILEAA